MEGGIKMKPVASQPIHLKCQRCDQAHEYTLSDEYIIAITAQWQAEPPAEGLLPSPPHIKQTYTIKLSGPLKIDLNLPFWATYFDPLSEYNGIETEEGMLNMRFCLCETQQVLEQTDTHLLLEIVVLKCQAVTTSTYRQRPEIGMMSLLESSASASPYVLNFKRYSMIDINIQSDLGLTVLIEKSNSISNIVAVNEWDFHIDAWYLYTEKLSSEKEKQYGIQHIAE